jgi:L-2-hydroxyglutarate oxidase LhgO
MKANGSRSPPENEIGPPLMERVECVVVGAGAVGLAAARALAISGRDVVVLERENRIGSITSARNSEVIHAGIYYPNGSLKARLCVSGRDLLYRYCDDHGISHRRIGKLIVAPSGDDAAALEAIRSNALANGVDDLKPLDGAAARALEPELRCRAALLSPSTGIIDSHGLMLAFQGDAEASGAAIALESTFESATAGDGLTVRVGLADGSTMTLGCRVLVNAGGLGAQAVAHAIQGLPGATIPPLFLAKGNYFTLAGPAPFSRLIYSIPTAGGLGIHFGLDLAGASKFGPDAEWIPGIDYRVDPARASRFETAIRRWYPGLGDEALRPGYAGVRPKIVPEGAPPGDFAIHGPAVHGVAGLVNLFGIESPGLTASLAIAERVRGIVDGEP